MYLYTRFVRDGQSGTGAVDFLCCLQVLLGWALIAPTIPIGKALAIRFTTHGTMVLSHYGSSNDGTVAGGARIGAQNHGPHRPSHWNDYEFNPDRFMHTSSIRHEPHDQIAKLSGSLDYGIRKTVETEVESARVTDFIMRQQI